WGVANRRSVEKALEHVGASAAIPADHDELRAAEGLVLPGVGAFPQAMRNLDALNLPELMRELVADGVPLLGICLGMQLLFDASDELGHTAGIGLIPGKVTRLQTAGLRVPHIGGTGAGSHRSSPLPAELPEAGAPFYHVHSYAARPADPDTVIGTTEYGERFATIVGHGWVFGVQFHPEKSSRDGLGMLDAFVGVCAGVAGARA